MNIIGDIGSHYYETAKLDGYDTDWILKINSNVYVNLTNIYFFRANSTEFSLNNSGNLNIKNCTFGSNEASDRGGAILNTGTLNILIPFHQFAHNCISYTLTALTSCCAFILSFIKLNQMNDIYDGKQER